MSWIKDRLAEKETKSKDVPSPAPTPTGPAPLWLSTWKEVVKMIKRDVSEFDRAALTNHIVTGSEYAVSVITIQPRVGTVTLQLDLASGIIEVTCPPSGVGIGRRGKFIITGGNVELQGVFVGQPKPPNTPMTPEHFSQEILEPFFFPQ